MRLLLASRLSPAFKSALLVRLRRLVAVVVAIVWLLLRGLRQLPSALLSSLPPLLSATLSVLSSVSLLAPR
jgi:hypothetical protein